jgi:predicted MPP superfamily phosphohydrolase
MLISEIITLAIFLFVIAAVYILELYFLAVFAIDRLRNRHGKNILRTKPAIIVHVLAGIGIICFLYGHFVEPYWIEVKIIPIQTGKLKHTSFRIVQISDLHCDRKARNEKAIVEIVNKLEPDVIVFTGDAVNTPAVLPRFKETMSNLKAALGKFAVYGNWETRHWKGLDYYSETGFELLDLQTIMLAKNGETLSVSGLNCDRWKDTKRWLKGLSPERFNIFLYHHSVMAEEIRNNNVDLYLCGHTHGGQVALPFYGALITLSHTGKKYESGMYIVNNMKLYVNRGIGMEPLPAPQVRFLARPEISVFDIGPEN